MPVQTIPLQLRKRASRASRVSRKSRSNRTSVNAPPSPGWASDSELEPASAVSGVSAARDVLSKSFSFSARTPATGFGFGDATAQEKRDSDVAFAREMGSRMARQDSATLPRDLVWESVPETKSISHKSSSQSLKKRKRDAVISVDPLPPLDSLASPKQDNRSAKSPTREIPNNGEQSPPAAPARKDSLYRSRPRQQPRANPPSLPIGPSVQKDDYIDQLARHRMSRIVEGDTDASSGTASPALSPPLGKGFRKQKSSLGSPRTAPSTGATSPSMYSSFTSPHHSPRKRSGPPSSRTDSDYESFLDGFPGSNSLSSPSFGRETSTKSPKSPSSSKGSVPLSASSISSSLGLPSGSLTGVFRTISEPPCLKRSDRSQPDSTSSTPSKAASQTSYSTSQTKYTKSTAITSPTGSVPLSSHAQKRFLPSREGSSSSLASSTIKTPVSSSQAKSE